MYICTIQVHIQCKPPGNRLFENFRILAHFVWHLSIYQFMCIKTEVTEMHYFIQLLQHKLYDYNYLVTSNRGPYQLIG